MNINEAKDQVRTTVQAYLATDESGRRKIPVTKQRPLFLLGAPGIGKTAIMAQVAQEMGIGLVSYSMTHHTRQSALGLPHIVHHDYGDIDYDASEYTMSEIVSAIYEFMDKTGLEQGILFLDEINCVSETLYPSMLQFLQFKTFGTHRIPDGWIVACAGNPPEYNRSVHEFDIVTMDRLRKVAIEPDLDAWREYAVDHSMHPAITSYLDVKKDKFYSVESTPEGKVFVTARGWEDLSEMMKVLDELELPVDVPLISQYLQKEDVAEDFALYYELFKKYRSDYKVEEILAGESQEEILERAKAAEFDERLALLGLLLDALSSSCSSVLEQEMVISELRDGIVSIKEELLGGADIDTTLKAMIDRRSKNLKASVDAGILSSDAEIVERKVILRLKEFYQVCMTKGTLSGEAAFDTIHYSYRGLIAELEQSVLKTQEEFDNAFAFVDEVFSGEREGLVFITELTARRPTSAFVSKFGSQSYYEHNDGLMIEGHRESLVDKVDEALESLSQPMEVEETSDTKKPADADPDSQAASTPEPEAAPEERPSPKPVRASKPAKVQEPKAAKAERPAIDAAVLAESEAYAKEHDLAAFYSGSQIEYGFTSLCKMTLPENLGGKKMLDIGSRRGRGVFKLSSRVGERGEVLGIDWIPKYVETANAKKARALRDSGLLESNMDFNLGYPEALAAAGAPDSYYDVTFINNVLNLTYDTQRTLKELNRVLKPGGFAILETVYSDGPRQGDVVEEARRIGNSIQAASSKDDLLAMLKEAGFKEVQIMNVTPVVPSDGAIPDKPVPVVETDEDATFKACVIHAYK